MSNQVALFIGGGAVALPEHLRGVGVDEQTKKLAGGGGGLRISIKGGVWRMLNDGDEIAKSDDRALNVVIVRSSPDNARTYYEGEYQEGEAVPPTCWSTNGVTPEPEVKEKQSVSCATCPQNIAGSGNGESRACRYSRQLAVVLDNDFGGKVFKLSLPATSLFGKAENNVMPLQAYGKLLVQHDTPVNAVVTEMRFDTTSATPKVGFKPLRFLTKEEYELVKKQGESAEAIAATKTTMFQQDAGGAPAAGLDIPGEQSATVSEQPTDATTTISPVVAQPAVTAATAPVTPKRTRAKPAATAAAEPAAAPAPAPAQAPTPAAPIKRMTEAAGEFTYEDYINQGWTDEAMIAEGYLVIETPKPAAPKAPPKPAAPKAPPAPKAAAAEPQVVQKPAAAATAEIKNVADILSSWDNEEG